MRKFDKSSLEISRQLAGVEVLVRAKRFREGLAELEKLTPSASFETSSETAASYHFFKGYILWELGDKKKAFSSAQKALEMYLSLRHFEGIAKSQKLVGSLFIDLGNLKSAREHLEIAVSTFKLSKQWGEVARALNQMAYLCIVQGHLKESLQYVEQSKEAALKSEDRYYAIVQDGVASVCHRLSGNWKLSIQNLNQFLVETKKTKDLFNYVTGLFGLGFARVLGGRTNEARKNYFDALQIATDVGLIGSQKAGYEYLAQLSIAEGRFSEAEDYLKKAMEIGERVSPYGTIMTQCWRLMGDLHNAKGEPLNALKAYETCESYLIKLPEELERGACFVGRGVAYAKLQQWKVSRDCFEKALDVFDQCENDWETAKAVVTAVEVGAYSAKQVTLQLVTARELFQKLEHPAWEQRVSKLLANSPEPLEPLPYFAKKENFEKQEILAALEKAGQNKTRAAELLGLPRQTLQHKIKKH
ncbi:MAG TPA: helix-turn-helix domain-containing protein, partial [Verrucomicrobiae bacterium]|nr:helix-turn-helix domain-containing protein [Verrucomicrobiae bacterium]